MAEITVESMATDDQLVLVIKAGPEVEHLLRKCQPFWKSKDKKQREQEGTILWKALFTEPIIRQFKASIAHTKVRQTTLVLAIQVENQRLNSIEWEALFNPEQGRFLCEDIVNGKPMVVVARVNDMWRSVPAIMLPNPLRVGVLCLGVSTQQEVQIMSIMKRAVQSLEETGTLCVLPVDLHATTALECDVFHILVKEVKHSSTEIPRVPGWDSVIKSTRNAWDRAAAILQPAKVGLISCIDPHGGEAVEDILMQLHRKRWPICARVDLYHGDAQDELALRDIFMSILRGELDYAAANAYVCQLGYDVATHNRQRAIHLFCGPRGSLATMSTPTSQSDNLRSYLWSMVASVEKFYKWERMYVELMFSTHLRLQSIDLTQGDDARLIQEQIFSLDEALRKFDRLVILGEPGTGKTTACMRAAWTLSKVACGQLARGPTDAVLQIPVYLPLRKVAVSSPSTDNLASNICRCLSPLYSERTPVWPFLDSLVTKCRPVIFLDGLNEVSPSSLRERLVTEVIELMRRYEGRLTLVVTSRKHNFDVASFRHEAGFNALEIVELSDSDIGKFARGYLYDDKSCQTFMSNLTRQLRISARNPLVLRLLLDNFRNGTDPIGSRAQLLKSYCRKALGVPCMVLSPILRDQQLLIKERILTEIAFTFWLSGTRLRGPMGECMEIVEGILAEPSKARALLDEIAENGILTTNVDADGQEVVEFRYQSYHEYFCGKKVSQLWVDGKKKEVLPLINKEEWHEIIALMAGIIEDLRTQPGVKAVLTEIDLVTILKQRGRILLAGMCIWNMERMRSEVRPFEQWLIGRMETARVVLTNIANYGFFGGVLSVWMCLVLWACVRHYHGGWYLWSLSWSWLVETVYLGPSEGLFLLVFIGSPVVLIFLHRRTCLWIARRQEELVLRPALASLWYIGSDYARGAIVDLFNDPSVSSILNSGDDDLKRIDPTRGVQREVISRARMFLPRQSYDPSSLIDAIRDDASMEEILLLANIVAKDIQPEHLRRLVALSGSSVVGQAEKAFQAGWIIVQRNAELREDWESRITINHRGFIRKDCKGRKWLFVRGIGADRRLRNVLVWTIVGTIGLMVYALVRRDVSLFIGTIVGGIIVNLLSGSILATIDQISKAKFRGQ